MTHVKNNQIESDNVARKRQIQHRHFAALSILTCGKLRIIGFSNMGHVDNDFITLHGSQDMLDILKVLEDRMITLVTS